jgi:3-methyladenine DNA glycosylase Tag
MPNYKMLWERIKNRLDAGIQNWEQRIRDMQQVTAVELRTGGYKFSNNEVFKALVLSVLSNSTNWAVVEKVLSELQSVFSDFDVQKFIACEQDDIDKLYDWFYEKDAASIVLKSGLLRLRDAARKLHDIAQDNGSLNKYYTDVVLRSADVPSAVAALGSDPRIKLPGLGIPLTAEFLKNIGFDVSKPDRHINRAVGSFGWVTFRNWPDRDKRNAPTPNKVELTAVMREMQRFASSLSLPVCYVDNAVWLLCARSGLWLSNRELASLCE